MMHRSPVLVSIILATSLFYHTSHGKKRPVPHLVISVWSIDTDQLHKGACLKLTEKKGVLISFEEVELEDIPEEIRIHLEES
ncbi:hypothetical protein [Paenibacillus medicaginis]|uniref:Uncharacterized protein n=1 Tax=Paenibacillus medicaginis TaxID=1470560 RepID=A0ABV5C594_9BACL